MPDIKNQTKDSVSPSLGGKGGVSILKILITVLTALAGALGVASCTKEEAPSNSPRGEDSIIAANIMHCQYENALNSRDV